MFGFAAPVGRAGDGLADALAGSRVGWLLAAVSLHVCGQVCRGLAWRGVLAASWPQVTRRSACAWHLCGAGLTGVLSCRGGDAVRIALARRDLRGASWPALGGTLVAEGSFEAASGLALALVAVSLGVGGAPIPSPAVVAAIAAALTLVTLLSTRSGRVRRALNQVGRGLSVLRDPRRFTREVLPWQVAGRLVRLASIGCFLLAFGLPASPAVIVAASVVAGSANLFPLPGTGTASSAAALLLAIPAAAGHHVDATSIAALAIVRPVVLTAVGVGVSMTLLGHVLGVRTPRALLRVVRSLSPQAADAAPRVGYG